MDTRLAARLVNPEAGLRAASQAAASRGAENAQVLSPLLPGDACGASSYSCRFPPRSHFSVIPPGAVITTLALDELIAAPPTSRAPELTVVTAGTVRPDTAVAELMTLTGASEGFDVSTPE